MQKRDAEERDLHTQSCDGDLAPSPSEIILFKVFRQACDNHLTGEVLASWY